MKKIFYVAIVFCLLSLLLASAYNTSCEQYLVSQVDGVCLQDVRQESADHYSLNPINYDFEGGRWLIQEEIAIPVYPVLLGSNFNKFRIVPVSVFYQHSIPTIYIQGKLICDQNGSVNPRLIVSIPSQAEYGYGYIANIHFRITNWNIIYKPCSY